MKKFFTALLVLFSCVMVVNADETCSYQEELELREKASNIRASYEVSEEVVPEVSDYDIFVINVSLTNITDDFYVVATNDFNDDSRVLTKTESGISSFEWLNTGVVTNHVFQVKASTKTNCSGITLKTFTMKTPRYNEYYWECANEFPDYELCQQFVMYDKIERNEFKKRVENYRTQQKEKEEKEKNKSFFEKLIDFLGKNIWIILGVIIVVAVGGYTFYYFKTKKQRELGL